MAPDSSVHHPLTHAVVPYQSRARRFGTDSPEELLKPLGWRVEVRDLGDYAATVGRLLPALPRPVSGPARAFLDRNRASEARSSWKQWSRRFFCPAPGCPCEWRASWCKPSRSPRRCPRNIFR